MTDAPETRAAAAEVRLRPSSIFSVYAAVLAGLCLVFEMQLGHFSVMPKLRQIDPRTQRYQLLEPDYAGTRVEGRAERDGLRIRAQHLRPPGVAVVLRIDKLFAEHDCPMGVAHRHDVQNDELAIVFEAKRAGRPVNATAQLSDGRGSLYSAPQLITTAWTKLRVPLREMGVGGTNFVELTGDRFLLIALLSETDIDVSFRNLRLLHQAIESH